MKKAWSVAAVLAVLAVVLSAGGRDPQSSWRDFQARYGEQWVAHRNGDGWVRSMYGRSSVAGASAEQSASSFLRDAADALGVDHVSDLRLASIERNPDGADFLYEQWFGGLRVAGGQVTVHVDRHNRVIAATSDYQRVHPSAQAPLAGEFAARQTVLHFLHDGATLFAQGLWIVASGDTAQPAWRFQAASEASGRSYLLYIDAADPSRILRIVRTYAEVTGDGSVYMENPIVTPATSIQPFLYLDGSTQLVGNFARTYNANFKHWYFRSQPLSDFTTASDPNLHFIWPTSDPRFAEAMAYFHINRVHDQWHSFGFNKLNLRFPVFVNVVNAAGTGVDNAFYTRTSNASKVGAIIAGAGNKLGNLGWDADVYYHEYGHAVLDRVKPGFFEAIDNNYPGAFHEAFGDISAAAITGNSKIAEFGLREKATMKFVGRDLQNTRTYPRDVILPGSGKSEVHYTGEIFGGTWWDLQKSIGRPAAQKILYRGLPMIPNEMTFFDVRDAMIQADANINGGTNRAAIQGAFTRHGLGGTDPGQPGKVVLTSIKTGVVDYTSLTIKVQFKSKFKRGDPVSIFAGYVGTGLTPGYNLIAENAKLTGPAGKQPSVYPYLDEVENGSHTGKQGAWIIDVDTTGAKPGKYTLNFQSRLGGTTGLLPVATVSFQVQ